MSNRFKPKFNIKKGDQVIVISGEGKPKKNDAGKLIAILFVERQMEKAAARAEYKNKKNHSSNEEKW